MSARSRLRAGARHDQVAAGRKQAVERWHHAAEIRDEWLAYGLSTERADRGTAEAAISELYALAGESPPRFEWVDSPRAAIELFGVDRPAGVHTGELVRAADGKHVAVAVAEERTTAIPVSTEAASKDDLLKQVWESLHPQYRVAAATFTSDGLADAALCS